MIKQGKRVTKSGKQIYLFSQMSPEGLRRWLLWMLKPACRLNDGYKTIVFADQVILCNRVMMLVYLTTLKNTLSPEVKDNSPPEVGMAHASEQSVPQH